MVNSSKAGVVNDPRVAIVTVTYNSAGVLPEFIRCIEAQTEPEWCLIVIDNASTDGSTSAIEAIGDSRILLVRNADNVGFARATNQGLRLAKAADVEWALILNNDTSFAPEMLAQLLERAGQRDASVYAPHIVFASDPAVTWYGGGHFSSTWGFRATLEGEGKHNWEPAGTERWVEFAPGCCKLVALDRLNEDAFYDEDFFVYWEDVDRCWRWRSAGTRIRYLPQPVIRHAVSALTGGENSAFSIRMYHLNQILFLRKNFSDLGVRLRLMAITAKIRLRRLLRLDSGQQSGLRRQAIQEGLQFAMSAQPGQPAPTSERAASQNAKSNA